MLQRTINILSSLSLILSSIPLMCLAQNESSKNVNTSSNTSPSRTRLYGRIEQLSTGTGAQFPLLKEQTAQLDQRKLSKTVNKGQTIAFSGSLIRSFPEQFNGIWGGHLKIWTAQMDAICWQLDSDEANHTRQLMIPGREGSVNFNFNQTAKGIDLEPAQVVFMVPMKDTNMQQELNSMLGAGGLGQAGGLTLPGMDSRQMATVMQQMANSMTVPIIISFGAINNPIVKGVSGNEIKAIVLNNVIRQLSPSVLEEQIISQDTQRNKKTGTVRQEYSETVIRFTRQSADTLYVQAAAVNYTADRKFERKLILYGTVRKGQIMQEASNPLGGMMPGQMPNGENPFRNLMPSQ